MISTDIQEAARLLTAGKVVAIPTETVYGLAADAFNESAVQRIFSIKQRPHFNPLIVHIGAVDMLSEVAKDIPAIAYTLAQRFWPGPLTLVLPKQPAIPDLVTAGKSSVAVRVPNHPVALKLLGLLKHPLAAPSANPFGSLSPTTAEHVEAGLGDQVTMILDGGPCQKGIESTIIGFENDKPVVYRLGSISLEDIESVTGKIELYQKKEDGPPAPGMLDKHYSPHTRMILCDDVREEISKHPSAHIIVLVLQKHKELGEQLQIALSEKGDLEEAARNLFSRLHELDDMGAELIIAERMPNKGLGRSINDRLTRASIR